MSDYLAPRGPAPRQWTILLVDDELDVLDALKQVVEASIPGVRVLTAMRGREGLDLLSRERIDVIISDFRMPGMDGIEFLYEARRMRPDIPRVMLTAYPSDELARRALVEVFVQEFIPKSASPQALVEAVRGLLRYVPETAEDGRTAHGVEHR